MGVDGQIGSLTDENWALKVTTQFKRYALFLVKKLYIFFILVDVRDSLYGVKKKKKKKKVFISKWQASLAITPSPRAFILTSPSDPICI